MTVKELADIPQFQLIQKGDLTREIHLVFCCDLLSVAMSKAPCDCAWITVMGNINALAVASLTDCACIILAEGMSFQESVLEKAKEEHITLFRTFLPIFDAGLAIQRKLPCML